MLMAAVSVQVLATATPMVRLHCRVDADSLSTREICCCFMSAVCTSAESLHAFLPENCDSLVTGNYNTAIASGSGNGNSNEGEIKTLN